MANRFFKVRCCHLKDLERLRALEGDRTVGIVWICLFKYAATGELLELRGPNQEGVELANRVLGEMRREVDIDRETYAERISKENKDAIDGVVFEGDRVRGVHSWVVLSRNEYEELVIDWGETAVNFYIAFIDRAAQKTGNKNGWDDWPNVVCRAIEEDWANKNFEYDF